MAEREGFEPSKSCPLHTFQACSFDRSDTSPDLKWVATQSSHTPAPESATTVAPFRAWRSSRLIVARGPERVTIEGAYASGDTGRSVASILYFTDEAETGHKTVSWPLFAVIQLSLLTVGISVAFLLRNRALLKLYQSVTKDLEAASDAVAAAKLRMTDDAERVWLRDRLTALDDSTDVGAIQRVVLQNELEPSDSLRKELAESLSEGALLRKILRSRWEPARSQAHQVAVELIRKYPLSYPMISQLHQAYGVFDEQVEIDSPTLPDPPDIPEGDSTDASQEAEHLRATNELLQKELQQTKTLLETKVASGENAEEQAEDLKTLLQQFTKDSRDMMACIQQLETENADLRSQLDPTAGASSANNREEAPARDAAA